MTAFGPSCPQQAIDLDFLSQLASEAVDFITNSIYGAVFPSSEDCEQGQSPSTECLSDAGLGLTINVVVPAGTQPNAQLPVVAVRDARWSNIRTMWN